MAELVAKYYRTFIGGVEYTIYMNNNVFPPVYGEEKPEVMTNYVRSTWDEVKALRDSSTLEAGTFYLITDYITTTTQINTQAASHYFDVLVFAIDVNRLAEQAWAVKSERDTSGYFNRSKVEAWELKYCLDNDTNRFAWADTTNGKGVIWYMKDEFNNECPYDFKNIKFERFEVTDVESDYLAQDALSSLRDCFIYDSESQPTRYAFQDSNISIQGSTLVVDGSSSDFYYTFTWINENGGVEDASIVGQYLYNDEGQINGVFNNKIQTCSAYAYLHPEDPQSFSTALNNIVIVANYFYEGGFFYGVYGNVFDVNCYCNTFGNGCYENIFGNGCGSNTFGNSCNYNTFGNGCYSNTFGNGCYENIFGNSCTYNTFGNSCNYNTFGNDNYNNTFGNDNNNNTFGNGCNYNTFGNGCGSNTFGNGCNYNTFGNGCGSNTFGNSCNYNTFGNGCGSNIFGNGCGSNTFGNNCNSNTFGEQIQNLDFTINYDTSSNNLQYIQVLNGYKYDNKTAVPQGISLGVNYSQTIGYDSNMSFIVKNVLDSNS